MGTLNLKNARRHLRIILRHIQSMSKDERKYELMEATRSY